MNKQELKELIKKWTEIYNEQDKRTKDAKMSKVYILSLTALERTK